MKNISTTITEYNKLQTADIKKICDFLVVNINTYLKKNESKIWHGIPVWFLDGNPVVAYSVKKGGKVSLMFFSGQSFEEKNLINSGKGKAAERFYTDVEEIKMTDLKKWLKKAKEIQWDYKNLVKNNGVLVKRN